MSSLYSSTPQQAQGNMPSLTGQSKVKSRTACWVSFIVTVAGCLTEESYGRKVHSGSWTQRTPRGKGLGQQGVSCPHGQDAERAGCQHSAHPLLQGRTPALGLERSMCTVHLPTAVTQPRDPPHWHA